MIIRQIPWHAVPQYAQVLMFGRPVTVMDPRRAASTLAYRASDGGVRLATVDPNALATVLEPETPDAIAALGAHFDLSIVEEK